LTSMAPAPNDWAAPANCREPELQYTQLETQQACKIIEISI
jgi:hypothetical protein